MSEEDHYLELDVLDIIDNSENLFDSENASEISNSEQYSGPIVASTESAQLLATAKNVQSGKSEVPKTTRLPMARIKNIIKMDPDVQMVTAEAVFLVTKATEMFLETIAKETFVYTSHHKRKTIAKKDLDVIINKVDCLCFLEGAMDF
ncbi:unnamed protein product [Leptidea sinapis]|uniref:Transcription factor CBF/NF-Y/archaeal histone domain-containing protein n=1 Tax=Leptidea sinapis TaxID=189913 RepID=A0A5E4R3X8_9NEOP|nr:unnamed protein product [Leptidea sinapis]